MYSEVAWVLVFSANQVQLEIKLNLDYLPDYHVISYDLFKKAKSKVLSL